MTDDGNPPPDEGIGPGGDVRDRVEIHPSLPKVDPGQVFGATIALLHPPRFTPQELLDVINEILEDTGAAASFDETMDKADRRQRFSLLKHRMKAPPCAMLRVNGLYTLVGGGDDPAFVGKMLREQVNPALQTEDIRRLSQSRGYVMIADAHPPDPDDADQDHDRAAAVTVTATAVSVLTDPVGVIWHPAGNATSPDVIPDFVTTLSEGIVPLPVWLRWLTISPSRGQNPGAASRGLTAVLGMEMEVSPGNFPLEKTVDDLFEIAAAFVATGKVPADRAKLRTGDETVYHVTHHRRGAVLDAPVFRLTADSGYDGN